MWPRALHLLLILSVVSALSSCMEKSPPPPDSTATGTIESAAPRRSEAAGSSKASGKVVPPKDAQWTILCYTVSGPAHVEQAIQLKSNLLQTTQLKQWHVIHGESQ